MKSIFPFLILVLLYSGIQAQITFHKAYWGAISPDGIEVKRTVDGGYIIGGSGFSVVTENHIGISLLKLDSHGDVVWHQMYGSNDLSSYGYHVQQTSDNGYIASGMCSATGGPWNIQLLKTDSAGNLEWSKQYNLITNNLSLPIVRQIDKDGGFIIASNTDENCECFEAAHIIRTDAEGEVIWSKSFWAEDGTGAIAIDVLTTGDGGFLFTGSIGNLDNNNSNVLLAKLDINGDYEWAKRYGSHKPLHADIGYSIIRTSADDGYLISGTSNSFNLNNCAYLIKTDANGDTLWTRIYGPFLDDFSEYYPVQQGADDNFYVLKDAPSTTLLWPSRTTLIKINASGDTMWSKVYTGGAHSVEPRSLDACPDSGMIIGTLIDFYHYAGHPQTQLIKTDINGNSGCNETYVPFKVRSTATEIHDQVLLVASGGTAITLNLYTVDLEDSIIDCPYDSTIVSAIAQINKSESATISVFPNPVVQSANIELNTTSKGPHTIIIRDFTGRTLRTSKMFTNHYVFEREDLPAGLYYISIYDNVGLICAKKIMIE